MKARLLTLSAACFTLLTVPITSPCSGTVVTFDDLSDSGSGTFFSYQNQGYQGLTWNSILYNNAILGTNVLPNLFPGAPTNGLSGGYYGMVSASNVALLHGNNIFEAGSEISSSGTKFNFLSAYLTGSWNSNLNIEVQGFSGVNLLYSTNVVASATSPTLFTFNYFNVDRLAFDCYGGEPAFGVDFEVDYGQGFVMDNLSIEFVPEPSTVLLTALGALALATLLKRRRA